MVRLRSSVQLGFLALVAAQSIHSIEEASTRLWEVWGPAATVSGMVSDNLAFGFAAVNSAVVLFGFWCYAFRVRPSSPTATLFIWAWALVESGNGVGHVVMGIGAGGYFPGLGTAPLLLAAAVYVVSQLIRGAWQETSVKIA